METKSKVKSACILLLLCTGILTMSGCSMGIGRETLENDVLRVECTWILIKCVTFPRKIISLRDLRWN